MTLSDYNLEYDKKQFLKQSTLDSPKSPKIEDPSMPCFCVYELLIARPKSKFKHRKVNQTVVKDESESLSDSLSRTKYVSPTANKQTDLASKRTC